MAKNGNGNNYSVLEKFKRSWIYAAVITAASVSAITWGVTEKLIVSPINNDLARQKERVKYLENTLSAIKTQYDIPNSVISEFGSFTANQQQASPIKMLNVLNQPSLDPVVQTTIERNQTTQIKYPGFLITLATSNVTPDGNTTFNVGYVVPTSDVPESTQFKLYPAQTMTMVSSETTKSVRMFYITLIASEPLKKSALVEVALLHPLKNMLQPTKP